MSLQSPCSFFAVQTASIHRLSLSFAMKKIHHKYLICFEINRFTVKQIIAFQLVYLGKQIKQKLSTCQFIFSIYIPANVLASRDKKE